MTTAAALSGARGQMSPASARQITGRPINAVFLAQLDRGHGSSAFRAASRAIGSRHRDAGIESSTFVAARGSSPSSARSRQVRSRQRSNSRRQPAASMDAFQRPPPIRAHRSSRHSRSPPNPAAKPDNLLAPDHSEPHRHPFLRQSSLPRHGTAPPSYSPSCEYILRTR